MTFDSPWFLLIALAPLLLAASQTTNAWRGTPRFRQIRRGRLSGRRITFTTNGDNSQPPRWRLWLAFVFAALALAHPRWGRDSRAVIEGTQEIVVGLDLSRSMLARDATPSRLANARSLARALVNGAPSARVALAGFAAHAYMLVPMSDERKALLRFLDSVSPEQIVDQGTDFGALLSAVQSAFSPESSARTLVLLSDGEAQPGEWQRALDALAHEGVRVVAVGVGTVDGASVPAGDGSPLRDAAGAVVRSRLEPATLRALAAATGGSYVEHPTPAALIEAVLTSLAAPRAHGLRKPDDQLTGHFELFLIAAFLMLCWSAARDWVSVPDLLALHARRAATSNAGADSKSARAAGAAAAVLLAAVIPHARSATDADTDPVAPLVDTVTRVSHRTRADQEDYLAVARATVRYGDLQSARGAPAAGILRDGLAAIERGRAIAPSRQDWPALESEIQRMLREIGSPPDEKTQVDPTHDIGSRPDASAIARAGAVPTDDDDSNKHGARNQPGAAGDSAGGQHAVGGAQRVEYDPSEWQIASLIVPLARLEDLREEDSPAEWFRLMQQHSRGPVESSAQPW